MRQFERKTVVPMATAIVAAANDWGGFHHPIQ